MKWALGATGNLIIAQNKKQVLHPAELPSYLINALDRDNAPAFRHVAVKELAKILAGRDRALGFAAELKLNELLEDDSRTIQQMARSSLKVRAVLVERCTLYPKQERVQHEIRMRKAEFCKEGFHELSSLTDEDSMSEDLVGGWILSDDESAGGAVKPAAVKHRTESGVEWGFRKVDVVVERGALKELFPGGVGTRIVFEFVHFPSME